MNQPPRRPAPSRTPGSVPRPTVPKTKAAPRTPGSVPRPNIPRTSPARPASSPQHAHRTNAPRPPHTRPEHVRPDVQRSDRSAEYARRQAAYARQMERKKEEERRRREQKARNRRIFLGRLTVFLIIFAILAAAGALIFFLLFNHTDETPAEPTRVSYTFGGAAGSALDKELAYRGDTVYIDFSEAADYLGMIAIGDAVSMRYVIPSDTPDATDSAGDGREEAVIFHAGDTRAEVNGQSVRLSDIAVLHGTHYLVPTSFLAEYMEGIALTVKEDSVSLSRTFTDEVADPIAFTLKSPAPPETLPPDTADLPPSRPTADDLTVEFLTDLSAYEKYMNPEDRDGYLILVNNQNTLTEDHKPSDLTPLADTRKDGRATQQMREYAAKSLEALYIEMRAAGYTDVSVTSAYRTYTYQNSLFNMYTANEMAKNPALTLAEAQAITATYSARPGTSEHQTGLCCDMHNLSSADQAFAKQEAYTWLTENAWKFGFILRFPEGKEAITEISFEPWHYRYVGRYHAKAIHDSGMCLEEYLDALNG